MTAPDNCITQTSPRSVWRPIPPRWVRQTVPGITTVAITARNYDRRNYVEITSKFRRKSGNSVLSAQRGQGAARRAGRLWRRLGRRGQAKKSGPNRHPEQSLDTPRWTPRRNASFSPCFPYVLRVRAFIFRYLSEFQKSSEMAVASCYAA